MTTTPDFGIPELSQAQALPHVTHNRAVMLLQVLANGVIDKDLATPPGSPTEGDAYIIAASPTGAWAGRANSVAVYYGASWRFVPGDDDSGSPITMGARQNGMRLYVRDERRKYIWTDSGSSPADYEWREESVIANASNIPFTPSGNIAAMNVAAAIAELDSDKVAKAGDTMTGGLLIQITSGNALRALSDGVTGTSSFARYQSNTGGAGLNFDKARGSVATPSTVSANDALGQTTYRGYGATGFQDSVRLIGRVIAGTPSDTDMQGRFEILVSGAGSVSPSNAWAVDSEGTKIGGTATANITVDANRIFRPRSYTVATLPTITTTGIIHCSDLGGGGAPLFSNGTAWCRFKPRGVAAIASDAASTFTWSRLTNAPTVTNAQTLTADRTVTLDTTGAQNGDVARFVRTGAGAFNWSIGGLKNLTTNTWCEVEYNGSAWILTAYGAL